MEDTQIADSGKMNFMELLLNRICSHYRRIYKTMPVGTGDISWIIQFYLKNGFRISHKTKGFFTDNYDYPMYEDGIQLADVVYLSITLSSARPRP